MSKGKSSAVEAAAATEAKMRTVLGKAAALVTPSREEEKALEDVVAKVSARLESVPKERDFSAVPEVVIGGSYAKGTWLRGQADVDFYLLYPVDYPREKLEGEAIEFAKLAVEGLEINMRYAEHPYVEAFLGNTRVNLVPCYRVAKGDWKSAADRSPFHLEYVTSHFDERLRQEARLLKKFAKNSEVYGAEVKTQGFSGYVCEVLALKFGSFAAVVEELSRARPLGTVVSIEPYDRDYVSTSFDSPIVILDPVDTTRNLGGAVSIESLAKFALECRRFLAAPSLEYFTSTLSERAARRKKKRRSRPAGSRDRRELLARTLVVRFRNEPRSVDILWGQLRKSLGGLRGRLEDLGFQIERSAAASSEKGESAFLLLFASTRLEEYYKRVGPEFFRAEEVGRFVAKNRARSVLTWIDGGEGRISTLFRRNREAMDALRVAKRILREASELDLMGLSKAIRLELQRGFVVSTGLAPRSRRALWLDKALGKIVTTEPVLEE